MTAIRVVEYKNNTGALMLDILYPARFIFLTIYFEIYRMSFPLTKVNTIRV